MKKYKVTKLAQRPGNSKKVCFYCQQPIGGYHRKDCILIRKKVLVKATILYEIEVPKDWDKQQIEFHRNDSTWCADNMLEELKKLGAKECCLCGNTNFKYIKQASEPYLEEK